jgi:hypothetical protein
MSVLAANRLDAQDLPLFLHVLGATILVGGLVAGASTLAYARGDPRVIRLGYWALLLVSFPGWLLMRVGGEWISSRQGWDDLPPGIEEPGWLDAGYLIGDAGGLLLLVAIAAGGAGVYRLGQGKGAGLLRATLVLAFVLIAAFLIAAWAMTGKPG